MSDATFLSILVVLAASAVLLLGGIPKFKALVEWLKTRKK